MGGHISAISIIFEGNNKCVLNMVLQRELGARARNPDSISEIVHTAQRAQKRKDRLTTGSPTHARS